MEVVGGFTLGIFTLFSVLYEAVEALQRMADPHHAEVHHTAATMDEEQPWLLGLIGFLLNCAAAAVFRAHQLEPAPAESTFSPPTPVAAPQLALEPPGKAPLRAGAEAVCRRRCLSHARHLN